MSESARKFLIGLTLFLGFGIGIGWIYGYPDRGLLAAALLALFWQVRQLLAFERALRTRNFDVFRQGDGIWQAMFSRFSYEEERSARYKKQYRQILREIRKSANAMPDGAVILDANNEIMACNRAAKSVAGLKRKKDRGQRVDNILRDPKLVGLLQSGDFDSSVEIESPVRDGHWINCRVVPYGADQKLLLLRDVTERVRLSRMRRDFVANASHELRSPLTVISGYLDSLVDDTEIPEAWAYPVGQMQSQSQRMNHVIGELLELSRLESGGLAGSDEVVDMQALLTSAKKSLQGAKGAPTIEIDCQSTAQIRGNSSEIESVVMNLVSNAIRYTPADGNIRLIWRSDVDGGELIVSDTGEGIADEHIHRLTERFFRVDRGRSRDDGGVGLGLAIVKHILERHEATLTIDSTLGEGSAFCCHFPADRIAVDPPVRLADSQ